MKSLFILSLILSCSASNFLIYDLPADHFDVAYGADRPSSEFGHFHAYVEVETKRTQRDDAFWVKTAPGKLRPGQIKSVRILYSHMEHTIFMKMKMVSLNCCSTAPIEPKSKWFNEMSYTISANRVKHKLKEFLLLQIMLAN